MIFPEALKRSAEVKPEFAELVRSVEERHPRPWSVETFGDNAGLIDASGILIFPYAPDVADYIAACVNTPLYEVKHIDLMLTDFSEAHTNPDFEGYGAQIEAALQSRTDCLDPDCILPNRSDRTLPDKAEYAGAFERMERVAQRLAVSRTPFEVAVDAAKLRAIEDDMRRRGLLPETDEEPNITGKLHQDLDGNPRFGVPRDYAGVDEAS